MNLMVFNNFVLEAVEKHIQVDVIYTDFAKAFVRVDHGCPIDALYNSGFGRTTAVVVQVLPIRPGSMG